MKIAALVLLGVVAAPARAASAPPDCVDFGVGDDPQLMSLAADKVTFCFDDSGTPECYVTALATGVTARTAAPVRDKPTRMMPAPASPKLDLGPNTVQVCNGSKCKTITARSKVDPGLGMVAAVSGDGALVALSSDEWIETYQVATKKRIARFATGPKQSSCNSLDWADDTLVVTERDCGKQTATAWLATRTGKRIAAVGGGTPIQSRDAVRAKASVHAFNTLRGDAVVFQDVKSGAVIKTISLGPIDREATASMLGDATRLVVIYGGSRAGDLAIIDLSTDKVTTRPATRCPH